MPRTTRTYTLPLCLTWGGDIQTGEADVVCTYSVDWEGHPYGPTDEMIENVEIVSVYGTPWADYHSWTGLGLTKAEALDELIQTIMWDHTDEMVEHATEVEVEIEERVAEAERRDWLTRSEYELDTDEKGNLTAASRQAYGRAKKALLAAFTLVEEDGWVWKP